MGTSLENEEYKEYYQTICEISPVGLFRTNNQGEFVYVNKMFEQITGDNLDDLQGKGWQKTVHKEDQEMVIKKWNNSIKKRIKFTLEFRIRRKTGTVVWVLGQATPINGNKGYVGTLTNINKRKKILEELMSLRENK